MLEASNWIGLAITHMVTVSMNHGGGHKMGSVHATCRPAMKSSPGTGDWQRATDSRSYWIASIHDGFSFAARLRYQRIAPVRPPGDLGAPISP
ncbi:hypothetical protein C8T65DRAFT_651189 [Cerioporus squamosus]|nr:hypothetical protein C8T65DRAFT_651189 [Cerioporus squamosus]